MKIKETFDKIMDMEVSRKKFLFLLGGSIFSLAFLSKGAFAQTWLRNDDSVMTNTNEIRGITDGTITRDGDGLVTSFVINGRTITINRDGSDIITGYEDSDYEWTLNRTSDIITSWEVAKK